ncbi:sugar nucleotidyltransferase [Halorubrum coriense DSM 10284]|uniref:Sugar nucleotidyltransferase n=1 Tax=Halorubrum coriense DSM 10284 TaxID=1227466 RepID=M0EWH2_9EURY|nr:sugar phosphate nucleotidyltransferase [Halorubrum coriense]ELZ50774.1 sugar nucleotidyltransferase [Halorubrum coriense DSM 10284]
MVCIDAVIPAAGRGSRLGELTADRPKGLVDVAGQPLLAHVFETAVGAGADALVVVVGYEAGQIVDRFGDAFEGVPITYVYQRERLGLGHAVVQVEPYVDGTFLLVNGDNVFGGSVAPAIAAVAEADAALAVEEVSPEDAATTGVIATDAAGRMTGLVEKPAEPSSTLVTTRCYVLPEDVFHACALLRPSAEGEYQLSEAVSLLVRAGYDVETARLGERVNVNTPDDVERASELVRGKNETGS